MRLTFTLLILMTCSGCSSVDNKPGVTLADSSAAEKVYTAASLEEYKAMYSIENYIIKQEEESKTETIDFDCAVLIYPTDEQIEEMKKTIGEEDFYTVADDNNWYQAVVIDLVDSLHIRKITANERYLKFKGLDGSWTLDIRKDNLPSWNLIFFKRTKEPEIVSAAGMSIEQVKAYFEIGK